MRRVVAVLATVLLAVAGCSSGTPVQKGLDPASLSGGRFDGVGLKPPLPRPNFTLIDTHGKQFSFGRVTAGHPTLLFFGYTHCPDVCPETMADVGIAMRALPAAVAARTYVVFVSTDVKRDTGPVIAAWMAQFDRGTPATFVGLRGTQVQVDAAQAAAHVVVAEDGGQTHSSQLQLYGADDYARVAFLPTGHEQQQIEHDLPLVAGSG